MPYRKIVFGTNEIYHILNRGVAQAPIFLSFKEYSRFLNLTDFYRYANSKICFSHYEQQPKEMKEKILETIRKNNPLLVEIYAYCLMPNHFHLLLKQLKENGISVMLSNLQNGYAKYFNLRYQRQGPLFQSMFKAVRIETDDQFLHVSRYIHLNPSTSYLVKTEELLSYKWSSFSEYLGERPAIFTNKKQIIDLIGGKRKYKEFVFDQVKYQQELEKIKHLSLEKPQVSIYPTPGVGRK